MKTLGETSYAEERIPFKMNLQLFTEDVATDDSSGEESFDGTDFGTPEEDMDPDVSDPVAEEETEENEEKETDESQSPEVNSAFAKMRKQLEKANKLIENIYGKDFGVKSIEELDVLYNKMEQEQMVEQIAETGQVDPKYIESLINNHPAIKAATQVAEDQRLISNFNELKAEYPELIKTADDIPEEVWDKFDKGISLVDAYTIVNRKNIISHYKDVSKQKTLNTLNSKKHLKTEVDGSSNGDSISIPSETLEMYMGMGMTKDEASAHYKKLYK